MPDPAVLRCRRCWTYYDVEEDGIRVRPGSGRGATVLCDKCWAEYCQESNRCVHCGERYAF